MVARGPTVRASEIHQSTLIAGFGAAAYGRSAGTNPSLSVISRVSPQRLRRGVALVPAWATLCVLITLSGLAFFAPRLPIALVHDVIGVTIAHVREIGHYHVPGLPR